jgi:hypothetical protein
MVGRGLLIINPPPLLCALLLGPTHPLSWRVPRALSLGIRQPRFAVDHSPPSGEVKKLWNFQSAKGQLSLYEFWGFPRVVAQYSIPVWFETASMGYRILTFQSNVALLSSGVEMSVKNYIASKHQDPITCGCSLICPKKGISSTYPSVYTKGITCSTKTGKQII